MSINFLIKKYFIFILLLIIELFSYPNAYAQEPTDAEEQFIFGCNYYSGKGVQQDYQKAAFWYTKSAEQGYAPAQGALADCYQYGKGVPIDIQKTVFWYKKAAEQGDADAQYELACCYARGKGVQKDMQKAAFWYTKSAEQGYPFGQFF